MSWILRFCVFFLCCNLAFADNPVRSLRYAFKVLGLHSPSVEKQFNAGSSLITLKGTPLFSRNNLTKRICDDYELLSQLIAAKGFYDAEIKVRMHQKDDETQIEFWVYSGQRYKLTSIRIELGAAKEDLLEAYPFLFDVLPIQVGRNVSAERVHETFDILVKKLGTCGYPFAKIEGHEVKLLKDEKRVVLKIKVVPGPRSFFTETVVKGDRQVPASFIRNRALWQKGDVFDTRKLELYRERLSQTRLFDGILVDYDKELSSEGVPVNVSVTERKFRTLSAGLSYSLNDGPGANLGWTHRNLTGRADRLRPQLSYTEVESRFELDYNLPDFIWPKTALSPSFVAKYEDTESYVSQSVGTAVVLRNEFSDNSDYFYGISLDYDRAKQEGKTKHGKLFGFPVGFKYDTRDDLFDPTRGCTLTGAISPRFGRVGDASFMAKTIVTGSIYQELSSVFVAASWMRFGSIGGINLSDVVANQRLYSGGGGSVRGYGYQMLGPLYPNGDPIGGKSLVEGGVELRAHLFQDWGVAAFFEGGYVDNHTLPSFSKDALFGAGAGVRYYTDFGPIRADIAIPLKRRKKEGGGYADRAIQFYISIGQGF